MSSHTIGMFNGTSMRQLSVMKKMEKMLEEALQASEYSHHKELLNPIFGTILSNVDNVNKTFSDEEKDIQRKLLGDIMKYSLSKYTKVRYVVAFLNT